jgi:hypothetical protein
VLGVLSVQGRAGKGSAPATGVNQRTGDIG